MHARLEQLIEHSARQELLHKSTNILYQGKSTICTVRSLGNSRLRARFCAMADRRARTGCCERIAETLWHASPMLDARKGSSISYHFLRSTPSASQSTRIGQHGEAVDVLYSPYDAKIRNEGRVGWLVTVTQPSKVTCDWLTPESSTKTPPPTDDPQFLDVGVLNPDLPLIDV